jgi:hypothetical protein
VRDGGFEAFDFRRGPVAFRAARWALRRDAPRADDPKPVASPSRRVVPQRHFSRAGAASGAVIKLARFHVGHRCGNVTTPTRKGTARSHFKFNRAVNFEIAAVEGYAAGKVVAEAREVRLASTVSGCSEVFDA